MTSIDHPLLRSRRYRHLALDGKLLLFDRETGTNVLLEGDETAHLVQVAPRVLQVALTNVCNKTCAFCYRPLDAASCWSYDEMLELARVAARWGVLELAFGGGEPTMFPRFAELLADIWQQTPLCPNFTTNGTRLTRELLRRIDGVYGQFQISIYDDEDYWPIIERCAAAGARFGLNYLVTPERARTLEIDLLAFAEHGARDVLLLSYKGTDSALHLRGDDLLRFDESVARLHERFGHRIGLKVDVCWGARLRHTPQLLYSDDCGAGRNFLSISSNRQLLSCSFADGGLPIGELEQLPALYQTLRARPSTVSSPGCARLARFGLPLKSPQHVAPGGALGLGAPVAARGER